MIARVVRFSPTPENTKNEDVQVRDFIGKTREASYERQPYTLEVLI